MIWAWAPDVYKRQVQGQEWTARSEKEDAVYPEGTRVWIREIQGVKLIVSDEKAVGLSQEKEEV